MSADEKGRPWEAHEDVFLWRLMHGQIAHATIAQRLGRTVEECVNRHLYLSRKKNAPTEHGTADDLCEEESGTRTAEERPMDPLQIVLLDFCKKYNELGQQLEIFSTFISQSVAWDDLKKQVLEIEAFRRQCVNPLPAHEFLALQLYQRYILVPRPLLVPREPEPAAPEPDEP